MFSMNHTIPENIKQVIDQVRDGIKSYEREGIIDYTLQVDDEGYLQDGEWLYVVVRPHGLNEKRIHASDFAQVLGEIELKLKQKGLENILLVPGSPD
jgi:hypothetical protein